LREAHDRMQELRALSYEDLIEDDDDQKTENRSVPAR
jgi:hypothetical protein